MSTTNCKGSFRLGTACGQCPRCQARNYGPAEREAALAAEAERTKDLPADRVKKSQRIKIQEN
jgi:hypothetical protein